MRLQTIPWIAALACTLAAACKRPAPAAHRAPPAGAEQAPTRYTGPTVPPPRGALSVTDHGARGDGVTDDSRAIQATITAARAGTGDVYFPPGTYLVSAWSRAHWCLDVPGEVRLHGAGQEATVLKQAADSNTSVRLLRVSGGDVLLQHLTLDGQRATQSVNEHRHGVFAINTDRLIIRDVTSRGFSGDGFYLSRGVQGTTIERVTATGNGRSGITLGATVDGTTIRDSAFVGNGAQQVDSEPVRYDVVTNTTITGSTMDGGGVSNAYALTISGTPKVKGRGWTVTGNTINGGVFVVWAEDVTIEGNTGINPTTKPSVTVYRGSADVVVRNNRFQMTQTRVRSLAGVLVQGTGTGDAPDRVLVTHNDLEVMHPPSFGVRVEGAIDVTVVDNVLRGPALPAPLYAGIYVRATNPREDFQRVVVRGNTIRDFGDRAISVVGNGAAKLLSVEIRDNTFENQAESATMKTGLSLDDGTGAARTISVSGNRSLRGVTSPLINYPSRAASVTIDDASQQRSE